jgi:hypothetical protein
MTPSLEHYPWYGIASGPDLQQGDILEECPVFDPESANLDDPNERGVFTWEKRSVIILTQSCDLIPGREKTSHVLLCAMWRQSDFTKDHHLASSKGLEETRRGNIPGFHMVGPCRERGFSEDVRLVDFRRTWSLPLGYVRTKAQSRLHLRLMPPYREHLSQGFARYFMRVGLPSDIPSFR